MKSFIIVAALLLSGAAQAQTWSEEHGLVQRGQPRYVEQERTYEHPREYRRVQTEQRRTTKHCRTRVTESGRQFQKCWYTHT